MAKRTLATCLAVAAWLGPALLVGAPGQEPEADRDDRQKDDSQLRRGEYLARHVAMCVVCHSPQDRQTGELIETRLFQGGAIPVSSPFPQREWAFRAPALAGLARWEKEEAVRLLMTGKTSNGWSPSPPMPPFRFNREDAAAVVAYLKSL